MRLLTLIRLGLVICSLLGMALAAAPPPELRVLIDSSGSMKQNDPQNFRAPALRMLVELLPQDAKGGVWTFGEQVTELVPPGPTDAAWREAARAAAEQIAADERYSSEKYTDIEQALQTATADWQKPAAATDAQANRNLLLLTDGLVDVEADDAADQRSRQRIRDEIIPSLAQRGIRVHTVALSEAADKALLAELAEVTEGLHEQVNKAEQLNRAFLHLFEESAPPDAVPIKDNRFKVDETVSDMTLLVFHAGEAADKPALKLPDGTRWTPEEHPLKVNWVRERGYDLITVDNPPWGEWQIDAPTDPDNRVTIVSNVRLQSDGLPARAIIGRVPPLTAQLEYVGQQGSIGDLLNIIDFYWTAQKLENLPTATGNTSAPQPNLANVTAQAAQQDSTNSANGDSSAASTQSGPPKRPLRDQGQPGDKRAGDGIYTGRLADVLERGVYEVRLIADGGSFMRELRQRIVVHDHPVNVALQPPAPDGSEPNFILKVSADPRLLQVESTVTRLRFIDTELPEVEVPLKSPGEWHLAIPPEMVGKRMEITVEGPDLAGGRYRRVVHLPLEEGAAPVDLPPFDDPAAELTQQRKSGNGASSWLKMAGILIAEHVLVIGVGYLGYRQFRRKGSKEVTVEVDSADTDTNAATPAQAKPERSAAAQAQPAAAAASTGMAAGDSLPSEELAEDGAASLDLSDDEDTPEESMEFNNTDEDLEIGLEDIQEALANAEAILGEPSDNTDLADEQDFDLLDDDLAGGLESTLEDIETTEDDMTVATSETDGAAQPQTDTTATTDNDLDPELELAGAEGTATESATNADSANNAEDQAKGDSAV